MSALGQKQTNHAGLKSGNVRYCPKADIPLQLIDVCYTQARDNGRVMLVIVGERMDRAFPSRSKDTSSRSLRIRRPF
jgi:hypothetical protein